MNVSGKRTKIVATIGPASSSKEKLLELIESGADVLRMNSAHTPDRDLPGLVQRIRAAAAKSKRLVGILLDLPGPKIRLGRLPGKTMDLHRGNEIVLVPGKDGGSARAIPVDYPHLTRDLRKGHSVFISDGIIRLVVESVSDRGVVCRVEAGGTVTAGKGVNLPDSSLSLKAFTGDDKRHMTAGIRAGVDFVGVSFVGNADDLKRARAFAPGHGRGPFLIAKIERQEALKNLDTIVGAADGIMVARGDLGVEVSFAEIPEVQRRIVKAARQAGKPVIVATQVLESMIENPRPTRAEVTDVANAVNEGADAVMLSGETSIGKFPVEAVQALARVMEVTEKNLARVREEPRLRAHHPSGYIVREACDMAEGIRAKVIVVPSRTGRTVMRTSRFRPSVPILAIVKDERSLRLFSLYWGVDALSAAADFDYANMVERVRAILRRHLGLASGDRALIISGGPGVPPGETGMVQIVEIL